MPALRIVVSHSSYISPSSTSPPFIYRDFSMPPTSNVSTPQHHHPTRITSSMSTEAIISLVFGAIVFFLALATLWQSRRRRKEYTTDPQSCRQSIALRPAVNLSNIEYCTVILSQTATPDQRSAFSRRNRSIFTMVRANADTEVSDLDCKGLASSPAMASHRRSLESV